jgi:glycosyltransferase involved in cell wall biosynthesis
MIRVLLITRYRDATMHRKVHLLAQQPDLRIRHICPRAWQDDLLQTEQVSTSSNSFHLTTLPMLGRPSDPHRSFYRTLTFGMRAFRPHIIHAEEEPDSLAALQIALLRRLVMPDARLLLHTWQNLDRPRAWYVRRVMDRTLQASDGMFCANQEAAEILRRHGYAGKMYVLPAIGVDTQTFKPCARPRGGDNTFTVGYIGRLVQEKGVDTLIDAIAQLRRLETVAGNATPPLRLTIVGGGPAGSALRTQVEALYLTDIVEFVPPVPPAQVARQLCRLDVLVLPSRTTRIWKEQLGRVLLEAMACKVPVVGSDSGAIPEVIGDAGLIFPEGDAAALAAQLQCLRDAPALRRELAEEGLARVQERYSQKRIASETARIYREVLT